MIDKLKVFEAFSGYGSQTLALKRLGIEFESVGISEIDKYAIATHESLHGKVKNYGNISKINTEDLPDIDLLTYSFPCQDISVAGKQRGLEEGSNTRSSLLWECQKVIDIKRPKFLMMENVKNLVGKKNRPQFDKWLNILEEYGYNNYWKVINAKNCGIPQNRERVFCVSILKEYDNGEFHFEDDFDSGIRLKDILEYEVDEKYLLSDEYIMRFIESTKLDKYPFGNAYKVIGTTVGEGKGTNSRHWVYDPNDYISTLDATMYKQPKQIYIPIKEATKRGYIECFPGDSINLEQPNSKTRRGRRGESKANTLTTSCNQAVVLNDFKIRKITPRECFRLMGLKDDEIDKMQSTIINNRTISNSQQYKLAGNSIVVNCMYFLKNLPK